MTKDSGAPHASGFFHGVNLGNWLVLEKWMSPTLFAGSDAPDEYYLPRTLKRSIYDARIQQHRAEFVAERDFALLSAAGVQSIRIPVPYFIFGDREPFVGCLDELDRAFAWAKHYGMSILIDLHTAPLGQNGFDNGGIQGVCRWSQERGEIEFVQNLLVRLAERYGQHPALYGIEVLNEPITERMWTTMNIQKRYPPYIAEMAKDSAPNEMSFLRNFYEDIYHKLDPVLAPGKKIVFHDAFELMAWQDFMVDNTKYPRMVLDTHQYLMIAEAEGCEQNLNGYVNYLEQKLKPQYAEVAKVHPLICGEWCVFNSLACGRDTKGGQTELNGITATDGAQYSAMSAAEKRDLYQALGKAQLDLWRLGIGHYYWSYKLLFDPVTNPNWVGWDAWDFGRCLARSWLKLED